MTKHARRHVYGRGCGGLPVYTSARIEATLAVTRPRAAAHVESECRKRTLSCACSEKTLRRIRGSPGRMFFAGPIASDRIREFQENRGRPLIDRGSTNESSASRAGMV